MATRPSPLRWPAPAETARHGRSKSTPVARSGGDRYATIAPSPLRWPAPAETTRHGHLEPGPGKWCLLHGRFEVRAAA